MNKADKDGLTPFKVAESLKNEDILKLLTEEKKKEDHEFFEGIMRRRNQNSKVESQQSQQIEGNKVESQQIEGVKGVNTPITISEFMTLVSEGNIQKIQGIRNLKDIVNTTNETYNNKYPIEIACEKQNIELVQLLYENGAKIKFNNDDLLDKLNRPNKVKILRYIHQHNNGSNTNTGGDKRTLKQKRNHKKTTKLNKKGRISKKKNTKRSVKRGK